MAANTDHPEIKQPVDEDIKVWRFMGFTKFMSLLSGKVLVFPRADQFRDPFEGSLPYNSSTMKVRDQIESGRLVPEFGAARQLEILDHNSKLFERFRKNVFISCWHANPHESAAMWDLYNADIAIQTTYKKLKVHLPDHSYIGEVEYLDYDTAILDSLNLIKMHYCKRTSFSHECEVRAVIIDPNSQPDTLRHAAFFDLEGCVEKVYVSPTSDSWLFDLTFDVMSKYGIITEVVKSDLYGKPLF